MPQYLAVAGAKASTVARAAHRWFLVSGLQIVSLLSRIICNNMQRKATASWACWEGSHGKERLS